MGNDEKGYRPIDCSVHDELLALATLGRVTDIAFQDERGEEQAVRDRIADVFTRSGAEYLRTAGGLEIRLDRLRLVDGRAVPGGPQV